jgi:hypothetical protein
MMTKFSTTQLRLMKIEDADLIAHVRRSASAWFGPVDLGMLQELVRRYELPLDRPALQKLLADE